MQVRVVEKWDCLSQTCGIINKLLLITQLISPSWSFLKYMRWEIRGKQKMQQKKSEGWGVYILKLWIGSLGGMKIPNKLVPIKTKD